jgi:protein tyrosine phosphatase (PTP) superfamily phosphohydrolase (DUF442 family)
MGPSKAAILVLLAALEAGGPAASLSSPRGVPNFHRVNDALYRGGQPSYAGLQELAQEGVKTVLDLRMSTRISDWEARAVKRLGMRYVHLPLYGRETPLEKDIQTAMTVLNDPAQAPVFVHCREGKDRTGMIIGCYRIAHDRWTNRRAMAEAKSYAGRELKTAMEQYILHFASADD